MNQRNFQWFLTKLTCFVSRLWYDTRRLQCINTYVHMTRGHMNPRLSRSIHHVYLCMACIRFLTLMDIILCESQINYTVRSECIQDAFAVKPLAPIGYSAVLVIKQEDCIISHIKYMSLVGRIKSFDAWPLYHRPIKEKLTSAGLFYSQTCDQTICFQCGITLSNWKPYTDPLERHAAESPINR